MFVVYHQTESWKLYQGWGASRVDGLRLGSNPPQWRFSGMILTELSRTAWNFWGSRPALRGLSFFKFHSLTSFLSHQVDPALDGGGAMHDDALTDITNDLTGAGPVVIRRFFG